MIKRVRPNLNELLGILLSTKRMSAWVRCFLCHHQLSNPRLLPCSHTFCLSCLESTCKDGKISCPLCSVQHNISPDALLPNVLVEQYINTIPREEGESQKEFSKAQAKPLLCDSEDGLAATKWCERCDSILCDQCWDVAHSVGKLKTHQPKPVVQGVNDGGHDTCSRHSHKSDFYCSTCTSAICHICWIEEHKDHEVSSLSQSAEQVKEELLKPCAAVLNNRSILLKKVAKQHATVQLLQAKLKALELKVEAVRDQLDQTMGQKATIQLRHDQVESVHNLLVTSLESVSDLDLVEKKDTLFDDIKRMYEMIYEGVELKNETAPASPSEQVSISTSAQDVEPSPVVPQSPLVAESSDSVLSSSPKVNPKLVPSSLRASPSPKTLRSPKTTSSSGIKPANRGSPSRKADSPKREISVPVIKKESKLSKEIKPIVATKEVKSGGVSDGLWSLNPESVKGAEHSFSLASNRKLVKKEDGHTAITCLEPVKDGRYQWKIKFITTKPEENWLLVGIQRKSQALSHSSHGEPDTYGWTVNHKSQTNGSWFGGRFTKMGSLLVEDGGILTLDIDCNGEELVLSGGDWSRRTDVPSSPQGYFLHLNSFSASFEIISCECLE